MHMMHHACVHGPGGPRAGPGLDIVSVKRAGPKNQRSKMFQGYPFRIHIFQILNFAPTGAF